MKVFNLIWGFTLGAGIDKCYLTYDSLSEFDASVEVYSVCINLMNIKADLSELQQRGITFIDIKGQKDFSWVGKLARLINQSNPDVIFTHGFNGAIMMLILRVFKGMKVPVICSYHGLYHAPSARKKIMEPVYNGLSRLVYKYIARKVICVENKSKEFLINHGVSERKIITVYNGIAQDVPCGPNDLSKFEISKKSIILITVSSLFEIKGLNYLLDAIALIKGKTINPFKYYMIGEGPELEDLKIQAETLKIDDIVKFAGYQRDIYSWLNAADIYALPSLSEAHSIALLEAMRSGKAIIATHVGGNPESVRNNIEGILVPSKDSNALAIGLQTLIDDPDLRLNLGQAARKRFEEMFTEDTMKENLIKALRL